MANEVKNLDSVQIVDFAVHTRKSKNGNVFDALYAYDEAGREFFCCFVKCSKVDK